MPQNGKFYDLNNTAEEIDNILTDLDEIIDSEEYNIPIVLKTAEQGDKNRPFFGLNSSSTQSIIANENQILIGNGENWAKGSFLSMEEKSLRIIDEEASEEKAHTIYTSEKTYPSIWDMPIYSFGTYPYYENAWYQGQQIKQLKQDTSFQFGHGSQTLIDGKVNIHIANTTNDERETKISIFNGSVIEIDSGDTYPDTARPYIRMHGNLQIDVDDGRQLCPVENYALCGNGVGKATTADLGFLNYQGAIVRLHDNARISLDSNAKIIGHNCGALILNDYSSIITEEYSTINMDSNATIHLTGNSNNSDNPDSSAPYLSLSGNCSFQASAYPDSKYGPLLKIEPEKFFYCSQGYEQLSNNNNVIDYFVFREQGKMALELEEKRNLVYDIINQNGYLDSNVEGDLELINWFKEKYLNNYQSRNPSIYNFEAPNLSSYSGLTYQSFRQFISGIQILETAAERTADINKKSRINNTIDWLYNKIVIHIANIGLPGYPKKDRDLSQISLSDDTFIIVKGKEDILQFITKTNNGQSQNIIDNSYIYLDTYGSIYNDILNEYWTESPYVEMKNLQTFYNNNIITRYFITSWGSFYSSSSMAISQEIYNTLRNLTLFNLFFIEEEVDDRKIYKLRQRCSYIEQFNTSTTQKSSAELFQLRYEYGGITPKNYFDFEGDSYLKIGQAFQKYGTGGKFTGIVQPAKPKDSLELYFLDNSKLELRNNSILDLRGPLDSYPQETYFDRSADSPLFCSYGGATFLMFGNERSNSVPEAYLNKIDNSPLMAVLGNSDIRFENEAKFHMNNLAKIEVLNSAEIKLSEGFYIKGGKNQDENSPNYEKYEIIFGDNGEDEQPVSFTLDELRQLKTLINSHPITSNTINSIETVSEEPETPIANTVYIIEE